MSEPDFVARYSRGRLMLALLACGTLVVGGLWMAEIIGQPPSSERYPKAVVVAVGWLNVLMGAIASAEIIRRLVKAGEHLSIGAAGIRCNAWASQTIPWSEIEEVKVWNLQRQKAIILRLHDPSRYPAKRLLASLPGNRRLTGGDIAIYMTGTDRSFSEALAAIEHYRPVTT
ncbi:hypothetical protein PK98_13005 [Croceibacterium mercuriale]|uniref:PH domain-containing protein n=1 Tax=Croceibacterium mercuriale TaxID=1572751 RepID=A0A0B2BXT4_9SPHN|nr:STM3941 family protein [Croceibacterium mercuriale]KHL24807.1 hypothetical protein PK98_13005 [Croceibacterium mercuriale]